MSDYTIHCLSEALSPITQSQGTAGNQSLISTSSVLTARGQIRVPVITGNALRNRCVRHPLMFHLVDRLRLSGKLSRAQVNFLLAGGSLTESTGTEHLNRTTAMREHLPALSLLGGCLPDQMIRSQLEVWQGLLVCEEYRGVIASATGLDLPHRWRPAESMIGNWQYTRRDVGDSPLRDMSEVASAQNNSVQMIYAGQEVMTGALFFHGYQIERGTPLELGALLWGLRLWQHQGGAVGGASGRGHGRLRTSVREITGADQAALCQLYCDHVEEHREAAADWLMSHLPCVRTAEQVAAAQAAKDAAKPKKNKKKPDTQPASPEELTP